MQGLCSLVVALSLVLFLAVLQGATELFPVSSLGHAVLVPSLLHLNFNQADESFVPLLTLLHLGTAAALLFIYRHDWARIIAGFVRASLRGQIKTPNERLAMLLLVGTIPTGIVGVVLQTPLKNLFAHPTTAAVFLIVNGAILAGAEVLRRRDERRHAGTDRAAQEQHYENVEGLTFWGAALVGACQMFALLPGISRSGVTMAGGLVAGLRHGEALRFSFLLATPIIGAAGLLEVPQLFGSGAPLGRYLLGAILAGAVAYASARFLIRYFHLGRLDPFAVYCAGLGLVGLITLH